MSTEIKSVSAVVNGTTYDGFTLGSDGYWEKTVTAPQLSSFLKGGHYPVTVTATDEAGNTKTATVTDFETLKLVVVEKEAPTVTFGGVTANETTSNATPTISIMVTDSNSGASSVCYVVVDNGNRQSVTLMNDDDNTATGQFTASKLNDGQHTITVYGYDNDGNEGSYSATFNVLTSKPSLTITTPSTETTITNNKSVTIAGTTNTGTGNTIKISLSGTDQGSVTVDTNGNFTKTLTLSNDGTYTIAVTATNSAGLTTTVTRTIVLDTVAPVFKEVIITPNPVDAGKTYTIRLKVE
jgi:hypothetical protein